MPYQGVSVTRGRARPGCAAGCAPSDPSSGACASSTSLLRAARVLKDMGGWRGCESVRPGRDAEWRVGGTRRCSPATAASLLRNLSAFPPPGWELPEDIHEGKLPQARRAI